MSERATKETTETNQPGKHAMILLLGSEPVARAALGEALDRAGYVVLPANNLGTAVVMLDESPVDLLIVCPYISEISGHEAARYLRTKCAGLKVLMVAGLIDDDRIRNWTGIEKLEIFPPPFAAAQLIKKVQEVLKTPQ